MAFRQQRKLLFKLGALEVTKYGDNFRIKVRYGIDTNKLKRSFHIERLKNEYDTKFDHYLVSYKGDS